MQTCLIGATVLPEILNTLKFRWYCGINFLYRHQWNLEAALLQVCEDRWLLLDLNERFLISSKIMDATIEKKKKNPPSKEDSQDTKTVPAKGFTRINIHRGQIPNQSSAIYHFSLLCHLVVRDSLLWTQVHVNKHFSHHQFRSVEWRGISSTSKRVEKKKKDV